MCFGGAHQKSLSRHCEGWNSRVSVSNTTAPEVLKYLNHAEYSSFPVKSFSVVNLLYLIADNGQEHVAVFILTNTRREADERDQEKFPELLNVLPSLHYLSTTALCMQVTAPPSPSRVRF